MSLIRPDDEHNRLLVRNVHPPDRPNPEPAGRYNLVVIGAGTAGLVAAAGAASLGARVALVERHLMGGDCLNVGCVPSKSIIRSGRALAEVHRAGRYGIRVPPGAAADFPAVMERTRAIRASISPDDSLERMSRVYGIDVFLGHARFVSGDTVEVDGRKLRFRKAVIATGARPVRPPIAGLEEAGYLTNETVFELTERPDRIAFIGAGPIGCELAQTFQRLGCRASIVDTGERFLPREDPDAAGILHEAFRREDIGIHLGTRVLRVARGEGGTKILHLETGTNSGKLTVDEILVGVGRAPNVEGMGLNAAGVDFDPREGIRVDDCLRTTNPRIFASGDCCMHHKFTHAADAASRIVIQNALFGFWKAKASALTIPWCTYTDPEIAHVGLYEHTAREQGIAVETYTVEMKDVHRAITEGETEGFVRIHVRKGSGRILGATIVAPHAGEMISEITLAMVAGAGLGTLARTIHPYPTRAEAIRKAGDLYNRSRLTPGKKKLLEKIFAWRR